QETEQAEDRSLDRADLAARAVVAGRRLAPAPAKAHLERGQERPEEAGGDRQVLEQRRQSPSMASALSRISRRSASPSEPSRRASAGWGAGGGSPSAGGRSEPISTRPIPRRSAAPRLSSSKCGETQPCRRSASCGCSRNSAR